MNLLLDTHIWLWSALDPDRLSNRVRYELTNAGNAIWLSPVSTWEALVLYAKARIRLDRDARQWMAEATSRFWEAPLTHEIVLAAHQIPIPQKDPADRFLAATAEVLGLTLVTADERLLGLGKIATLANR